MEERQGKASSQDSLIQCSRALALGYLAAIFLTPRLWGLAARSYPRMSYLATPPSVDTLVSLLMIASLIAIAIRGLSKVRTVAFIACQLFLFSSDAMRIVTWSFCYTSFFCIYAYNSRRGAARTSDTEGILRTWRFLVIAIYFWSGINKLNVSFILETCPDILRPLTTMIAIPDPLMLIIGVSIPLVETLLPLFLIVPKLRFIGILGLYGMHAFILFSLGPLGMNTEEDVWAWNLVMCFLLYRLFLKQPVTLTISKNAGAFLFALMYLFLPLLYSVNLWYGVLSFNMFSGRAPSSFVYPSKEEIEKAPKNIQALVKEKIGIFYISTDDYSEQEFKIQAFQTVRGHLVGLKALCHYFPTAKVLIQDTPPLHRLYGTQYRSSCETLDADVKNGLKPSELRIGKP